MENKKLVIFPKWLGDKTNYTMKMLKKFYFHCYRHSYENKLHIFASIWIEEFSRGIIKINCKYTKPMMWKLSSSKIKCKISVVGFIFTSNKLSIHFQVPTSRSLKQLSSLWANFWDLKIITSDGVVVNSPYMLSYEILPDCTYLVELLVKNISLPKNYKDN